MSLPLALLLALAKDCAPQVAPQTLLSVARVESGFDPFTIGVNGAPHLSLHAATVGQAVQIARRLSAQGRDFDLGLAQINVRNLPRLGLSMASAFDPCANLAAEARVLTETYVSAARGAAPPQAALRIALSFYNTGDPRRGFRNGYVQRVVAAADQVVPAIERLPEPRPHAALEPGSQSAAPVTLRRVPIPSSPASLDVFAHPASPVLVFGPKPDVAPPLPVSDNPGAPT